MFNFVLIDRITKPVLNLFQYFLNIILNIEIYKYFLKYLPLSVR